MSDRIPQCYFCKNNPCKWYSLKHQKNINIGYDTCKHFKETQEAKDFYKSLK